MKHLRIITITVISLAIITAVFFFCTGPIKPDFSTPDPFSFVLYSNSSATDTINSGDTSIIEDTLFFIMLCNRPGDIDTFILELKSQEGTTLFDTTESNFDTAVTNKFLGHYIPDITGTITLNLRIVLTDSLVADSFQLFIVGLPPSMGNNKEIQASGAPHTDSSFFMYISASGTDTLKYQWYKGSSSVSGQTKDTLNFAKLAFQDTGSYYIIVTNDWGVDTSKVYHLELSGTQPSIGNNKEIQTSGNPFIDYSFSLYISATGTDTLKYKWFKDNVAINGQIKDTLSFTALAFQDTGSYHIIVTNDWGADTSKPYNLSFHTPHWSSDTLHASVDEGVSLSIILTDSCTDPDNDTLAFTITDGLPTGDTVINSATYSYTPTYSDAGAYFVTIQASDGTYTRNVILMIIVNNVNRKPVFLDSLPKASYKIDEGDSLIIDFKATDPDNDTVIYILAENTLPRSQTVIFNDSQMVWGSSSTDSGLYEVSIYATDTFDTAKALVDVAVGNVNLPPQISIDGFQLGDTMKIREAKILTFTVEVIDPDTSGTLALLPAANKPPGATYDTATGLFTYTPEFSVSTGSLNTTFANVTFYATDNSMTYLVDTFMVHIAVLDSNSAPKWAIDSDNLIATEGTSISYNFSTHYIGDDEGDSVTFSIPFGTFNADTTLWIWTPDFNSNGDTICEITASDNHTPSAQSKLTFVITVKDSTPAVTLSKPTNLTYRSMLLSWTQSTDPDFSVYKLYYSTSPGVTEQSTLARSITDIFTTTATIDSLSENTHYYAKMFVYNTNLSVSGSNEVDSTTLILSPPNINITYPTVTRDSCFVKEISPSITGNVSTAAEINIMSATINGVAATVNFQTNNNWSLNVSAATKQQWNEIMIHAEDVEGKSTDTTFYMYSMPTLTPPTGFDTSNTKNRSIKLSWEPAAYCTRYRLYRSQFSGGPYTCITDTAANSFTDTLLPINTQYWYQVKGYYGASGGFNMQDSTDFSSLATGKTKNWFFLTFLNFGQGNCVRQTTDSGYIALTALSLTKTNPSGDTAWSKTYSVGGELFEVEQTSDGGYIIVGYTETATAGGRDVYLLKTDSQGNIMTNWPKKIGGANDDEGRSVEQTSDGGFIITGLTGSFGAGNNDIYIVKTDASGEISSGGWSKTYGGNDDDRGISIIQTSDGGYAISGFASSFNASSDDEVFLLKVNNNGDTTNSEGWFSTYFVGYKYDNIYLFQMPHNGYIISGLKNSTLNFLEMDLYGSPMNERTFSSITPAPFSVDNTSNGFIITAYNWSETKLVEIDNQFNILSIDTTTNIMGFQVYGRSIKQTFEGGFIITGYIQNETETKWFLLKTDENGYYEY